MIGQLFEKIAAKARQRNSVYYALSLIARVFNALGMFLALRRFAPTTFGEMSYLLATSVSVVAFCSFGIEISVNSQLTRKLTASEPLAPTIVAAVALALAGIILASAVICTVFAPELNVSTSAHLALLCVCVYSSCMIITSLLTSISFALNASVNVGVNYMITTLVFILFALFANEHVSGLNLLMFFIVGQVLGISYMVALLPKRVHGVAVGTFGQRSRVLLHEARTETGLLFSYGIKQILVVSAVTFSQWLIQRKIVFGHGGTSDNAIYSVGNQVFNMMTFIPLIITPIVITRLAAAGKDLALRRTICLGSLKLFAGIAVCAWVGAFVGLRFGIPYLPPRYAVAMETGLIAAAAGVFQIIKSPFSLFFLSELKASREIVSATAGALVMIIATSLLADLNPNQGTTIRLAGCAVQAILLSALFFFETRRKNLIAAGNGALL